MGTPPSPSSAPAFIRGLLRADAYDHAVDSPTLSETHISWVILTGRYVYKIKKPVNFGFLDFSTLERRRFFCAEELRLNGRLAPQLYLDVVAICGDADSPVVNGDGEAFEYAVKMRQFDPAQSFEQLLADGRLNMEHMRQTAEVIARFHRHIAVAGTDSEFGSVEAIAQPVLENFQQLRDAAGTLLSETDSEALTRLEAWSQQAIDTLGPVFEYRRARGFVRECHGDLHLGNIVLWQGKVVPFDGIEFSASLRWIDVLNELAFTLMDLDEHRRPELSRSLLNHYLGQTGDYRHLELLRFYRVYRAMVRAKVAALRLAQSDNANRQHSEPLAQIHNYIQIARDYTGTALPRLLITHGLSGSGKSTVAQALCQQRDIVQLRSDVERKRLFGLDAHQSSGSGIDDGIYTDSASQQTYALLRDLAAAVLQAGYSVIVDAAFLKHAQRQPFRELAAELQVPFLIVSCRLHESLQRERIQARAEQASDASEADPSVLEHQLKTQQPLGDHELDCCITVDTGDTTDTATIIDWFDRQCADTTRNILPPRSIT